MRRRYDSDGDDDEFVFDDEHDATMENENFDDDDDDDGEFEMHDYDDDSSSRKSAPVKAKKRTGATVSKSRTATKAQKPKPKAAASRTKTQKQTTISFDKKQKTKKLSNTDGDSDGNEDDYDDDDYNEEHGDFEDFEEGDENRAIEQIYQKKSQLEHILLRPDTYIGSTEATRTEAWVYDVNTEQLAFKKISIVPGLYKIFDEILVNAADNKIRSKEMNKIKINIDQENGTISVWNNGKGIPVEMHKEQKMYVPTMIFGHLLTGSNFDDDIKKVTGGRNGYGAKLANIFSKEFIVETVDNVRGKKFRQVWRDNMSIAESPKITSSGRSEEYTMVTFKPDLTKFNMDRMDNDIVSLMMKRAYDVAGTTAKDVSVWLNGKRLSIKSFRDYVNLYIKLDKENQKPLIYEDVNDRWSIGVSISDGTPQQVSFVNSICTTKGGKHVSYIADQVSKKLLEHIKRRHKNTTVKPSHIKNHLFVFVNSLIINPAFDSQTKETLTTNIQKFGSRCVVNDDFMKKVIRCGVVDTILSFAKYKENSALSRKASGSKKSRLHDVAKLDDANDAGGRNSHKCTLILTEGDSAKALAISGLSVLGRDHYGVFPLKGKPLNVRDASASRIMKNEELSAITKIVGLRHSETYNAEDIKKLRYGSVMIMADQDHDGSHIKGLVVNFIHKFWPSLLKVPGFIKEFITPIVRVTNNRTKEVKSFFTIPEYENWKLSLEQSGNRRALKQWSIKYYKGLGTSTALEAKQYFSNLKTHQIQFEWEGDISEKKLLMAFQKDKVEERKQWINQHQDGTYIDHSKQKITISDFIDKELILFSIADNARSIPSLVDGLKPGQRKILYSCFKRNLKKEIKVVQLAGYVSEHSAYHHGEQSLNQTIIKMAQDFVGSNNINLLYPSGQFGTRLQGGNDSASPRYVFTRLSEITRHIFKDYDDRVLTYLDDDGMPIEPKWYVPILPMVLVNGAEGIGSGWSTKVPQYNPRDIVDNIRRILSGQTPVEMHPWYKGFKGEISFVRAGRWETKGIINKINDTTIEITELPIGMWTQTYKEMLVDMMEGSAAMKEKEKNQREVEDDGDDDESHGRRRTAKKKEAAPVIKIEEFRENHTNTEVHFTIYLSENDMAKAEAIGLEKVFKLTSSINTTNMTLFAADGRIQKYDHAEEILLEFYDVRLRHYELRKQYLVDKLTKEFDILDNKVRFIRAVINEEIILRKRKKSDLLKELVELGFTPYSKDNLAQVHSNVPAQEREALEDNDDDNQEEEDEDESVLDSVDTKKLKKRGVNVDDLEASSYNYLLSMPLWSLTMEKANELENQRSNKQDELEKLRATSIENLWLKDLDDFEEKLDSVEQKEEQERVNESQKKKVQPQRKRATATSRRKATSSASKKIKDEEDYVPSARNAPTKRRATVKKVEPVDQDESDLGNLAIADDKPTSVLKKASSTAASRASRQKQVTFLDSVQRKSSEKSTKRTRDDSDDGENNDNVDDGGSNRDEKVSLLDKVMKRAGTSQRASTTKPTSRSTKNISNSVSKRSDIGDDDDDPDDIFTLGQVEKKAKQPAQKRRRLQPSSKNTGIASYFTSTAYIDDDDDDGDDDLSTTIGKEVNSSAKGRKKPATSSKARATGKKRSVRSRAAVLDESDDDHDGNHEDDEESEDPPTPRPTRTRRTAFTRAAQKSVIEIDSEDDNDDDNDDDLYDSEE